MLSSGLHTFFSFLSNMHLCMIFTKFSLKMCKYGFPILFQVLFVLLNLFRNTHGELLASVVENIEPHRDIYLLSNSNVSDEIQKRFGINFMYSVPNFSLSTNESDGQAFWDSALRTRRSVADLTIIISLDSVDSIFQNVEYIGKSLQLKVAATKTWTIVLWPTQMQSLEVITNISQSEDFLRAVKFFRVNSNLYWAFNLNQSNDSVQMAVYEAYVAANFTVFRHLEKGTPLFSCNQCEGPSLRRFNFHQRNLKVTAVNDTEINDDIHVYMDPNGAISYSSDGLSGTLLEILKQLLNFTVEPMLSKEFGMPIPGTNQWTGSIGDVIQGTADLAMSITIFRPERAAVVSFLPPVDEHLINAFFTPSDVNSIRDIFAQPFKLDLWIAVVMTWLVLALCMILFSVIRKRYGMDGYADGIDDEDQEPDFTKDSFMWALGTVCQQGWEEHPKAGSLRTIFISGSFTGVIAYAGYSAAIVSTLSLRVDPIQNPLQLLKSNLHVGIRKGFISNLLEQNNTRDTMSKFYKKLEASKEFERYLNVSSGLDRLLRHPYAFITTRDTLYDLMKATTDDKVICGIKELPILKMGFPLGYPITKTSSFKEILRYALIMIREPGILYRLRGKYSFQRRCLEASDNTGYALGPNDVFTAFMILLAGFALSIIFLVIERMIPFQPYRSNLLQEVRWDNFVIAIVAAGNLLLILDSSALTRR